MPHKRAKLSARRNERQQREDNLAPQKEYLNNEPIPKAVARVLNAATIREQYRLRKRNFEDDNGQTQVGKRRKVDDDTSDLRSRRKEARAASKLTIKPGESIQHFNRRVEDDMRPLVKAAVQSSNTTVRNTFKAEKNAKNAKKAHNAKGDEETSETALKPIPAQVAEPDKHANKAKEFLTHSSSAPRRLNDIAQAPPEFKRLPRGAVALDQGFGGKRDGVLSMAQKQLMEKEREKAISRYREMKSRQRVKTDQGD
ncbi:hypothetical protein C0992_007253 [Termitomyces sp. T32_za158]|nr:hypothetical protein C0992_007253 [Termitomyces sp. T32_za158]